MPGIDLHYHIKHLKKKKKEKRSRTSVIKRLSGFPFFTCGNPHLQKWTNPRSKSRWVRTLGFKVKSVWGQSCALHHTAPYPGCAQWWEGRRPRVRRHFNNPCVHCVASDSGQQKGNGNTGSEVWANKREDWSVFGRQFGEVVKALVFESDYCVF